MRLSLIRRGTMISLLRAELVLNYLRLLWLEMLLLLLLTERTLSE